MNPRPAPGGELFEEVWAEPLNDPPPRSAERPILMSAPAMDSLVFVPPRPAKAVEEPVIVAPVPVSRPIEAPRPKLLQANAMVTTPSLILPPPPAPIPVKSNVTAAEKAKSLPPIIPVVLPIVLPKRHILGVRTADRVFHHPIVPSKDMKLQLETGVTVEPLIPSLPDLVHHYTHQRAGVPYFLRDNHVGFPSVHSRSRIHLDSFSSIAADKPILRAYQNAANAVSDAIDRQVDSIFESLVDQVINDLLENPPPVPDRKSLQKHTTQAIFNDFFKPLSETASVERTIENVIQYTVHTTFDRLYDDVLDAHIYEDPQEAIASDETNIYEEVKVWKPQVEKSHYGWYRPDMVRRLVTNELKDKKIGEFIVYECSESVSETGEASDPMFDLVEPIIEVEETEIVEEEEFSGFDEGQPEPVPIIEPVPVEEPEPEPEPAPFEMEGNSGPNTEKIVITGGDLKKPRALPIARRVTKVARIIRKGELLGTFMDDSHLDVEVDKQTRLVIGPKRSDASHGPSRKKSYGQSMFPQLPSFGGESTDDKPDESEAPVTKRDSAILHADHSSSDDYDDPDDKPSGVRDEKTKQVTKKMALLLGAELLELEVKREGPLWMHAKLTRDEAEKLLMMTASSMQSGNTDGLFLVRESSKAGKAYSLDMYFEHKVHRYLFKQKGATYTHKNIVFEVNSIESLIEHLRNPAIHSGMACSPRLYVSRLGGTNDYFSSSC